MLRNLCTHPQYAVQETLTDQRVYGDRKHELHCTLCGKQGYYSLATGTVWKKEEVNERVHGRCVLE